MKNRINAYSWRVPEHRLKQAADVVAFSDVMIRVHREAGDTESGEVWALRLTRRAALAILQRPKSTESRVEPSV